MMTLPLQVNTALALLEGAGFEGWLVGGAVRDYVRDNSPGKDWDIATNALPQQVQKVFGGFRLIETGLKHGTVTVLLDKLPLEITTYRVDGPYSDHRRPDSVAFARTLREDLERRDFTMNALAYHPRTGVVDLVGGLADIAAGLVRCVGDPDRRFREDGLRILRALRFASALEMGIEEHTAAAVHRNRGLLAAIAPERVREELTRLLCGPGVRPILEEFADVLAVPLPEIIPMFGFDQRNPHHDRDVWGHTAAVVAAVPPDPALRWAALLHDMGKPACFFLDGDGVGHFYGHNRESERLAGDVLSRLRFDNHRREAVIQLVRHHDQPIPPERKPLRRLVGRLGADLARQLIQLHRADTLGQSPLCAGRLAEYDRAALALDELLREEACFSLKDLAVDGHDMIALGLRGREVGAALQGCLEGVLEERLPNDRAALLEYARHNIIKNTET